MVRRNCCKNGIVNKAQPYSGAKEKGVLAKGVSVESCVTAKERKILKDNGRSSTFGTQSATAKRGVHFVKAPFQKPPFLGS